MDSCENPILINGCREVANELKPWHNESHYMITS